MSDPKRLLDESLSDDERRALTAGSKLAPPAGTHDAVLAAVLAKAGPIGSGGETGGLESAGGGGAVGGATGVGGAAGVGAATKAGLAVSAGTWLKAFGVGGGLTAAALIGHEVTSEPPPAPVPVVASVSASPPPVQSPPKTPNLTHPPDPAPVSSAPTAPRVVVEAPVPVEQNDLPDAAVAARWESARVAQARAQLRSGQAAAALKTLAEIQRRVPSGVLGQEREALTIEALATSGQASAASRRAQAFVQRFPSSPHASRVRGFIR